MQLESTPATTPDPTPAAQGSLAALTADDILNSNTSQLAPPLPKGTLLSLEGLPNPSRSSARQALGITIVRQPGRRGDGDQVLEPLLYLQLIQPSALLSCHHRKQRMEVSVFDVALRGVASDYKCLGKRGDRHSSSPPILRAALTVSSFFQMQERRCQSRWTIMCCGCIQ